MFQEFLIDTLIVVFLGCLVGGFQHRHSGKYCDGNHEREENQISTSTLAHP